MNAYLLRVPHCAVWILTVDGERVVDVSFADVSSRPDPITRAWDAIQDGSRKMPVRAGVRPVALPEPKARGIRSLISWLGQQAVRMGRRNG